MNIATYLKSTGTPQATFAASLGLTQSMIWQWINGRRPIPVRRCAAIERATNGAISRQELRPDDWADIWPELKTEIKGDR